MVVGPCGQSLSRRRRDKLPFAPMASRPAPTNMSRRPQLRRCRSLCTSCLHAGAAILQRRRLALDRRHQRLQSNPRNTTRAHAFRRWNTECRALSQPLKNVRVHLTIQRAAEIGQHRGLVLFAPSHFSGVMSVMGRSMWPSRISNRRCSSRLYVSWSGHSSLIKASSSGFAVVATVEFLYRMVTR